MTKSKQKQQIARGVALGCLLPLALMAQPVLAQDIGKDGLTDDVGELRQKVVELQQREAAALKRVEDLEARLLRLEQAQISDSEAASMRAKFAPPEARPRADDPALAYFQRDTPWGFFQRDEPERAPGSSSTGGTEPDRKAPAPTEAVTELTEQRQGRFGDRLGLEMGFAYSHFDSARLNLSGFLALDSIFLGRLSIDQVSADIMSVEPTVRLGVNRNLVLSATIPYIYRSSNFRSGGAGGNASGLVEETVRYDGFGDLTTTASLRLFKETAGRPDIVLNGQFKVPTGKHPFGVELREVENSQGNLSVPVRLATGSGVYGAALGISALKTMDPMVVFGSVMYYKNFRRSFGDIDEAPGDQPGKVSVGDAYQIGAGLAYALNDRSSISMSYTQRIVQRAKVKRDTDEGWRKLIGSQATVALMNFGATFSLNKHLSLIATVGMGLTDDSPDMTVGIRIPYRF